MTFGEMNIAFQVGMDKVASLSYANFLDEQIDFFLNQATLRFINTRMQGNNVYQYGLEETQKRVDDLRELVKDYSGPLTADTFEPELGVVWMDFPDDYLYLMRVKCLMRTATCGPSWQAPKQIQHDDLEKILYDPFNKPDFINPIFVIKGTKLYFYGNPTLFYDEVKIQYISYPVTIDSTNSPNDTLNMAKHTHQEIVDIAVGIALEDIESPRWQSQQALMKNQE